MSLSEVAMKFFGTCETGKGWRSCRVRSANLLCVFVAAATLTACGATSGNPKLRDEAAVSQIAKGVTTMEQVRDMYGEPQVKTNLEGGEQKWNYAYVDMRLKGATFVPFVGLFAGGTNSDVNTLELEFDRNGKVKKITTGKGTIETQNFGGTKQNIEQQEK